ncbi:MAG: hypothetical protein J5685_12895 [Clostridiales bacterium]|nr:hypothetical protein [Clostridiales bacterium]
MAVICDNCSGKLFFNPATQKLECVSCGSSFRPEDVCDKDAELHSRYYSTRVYSCRHCGAEVITSDTEASTFCVYCGNPAIVFNRISREYKPDGILPFKITKEEAVKKICENFLNNPFVPSEVKKKAVPANLRGIYIPYWIVNADYTEADIISGEIRRNKRTYTELYSRAGKVRFKNIPVDGSKILTDDLSCKLEPYFLEDCKVFDEDYLNGFYSNTSDLSLEELKSSSIHRCHKLFGDEVMKTVKAANLKFLESRSWIDIHDDPLYMMLPAWFFTFIHKGKPYTVLVNGQTGKVVGTMPWDNRRVVLLSLCILTLVLGLTGVLFWCVGKTMSVNRDSFSPFLIAVPLLLGSACFAKGRGGLSRIMRNLKLTQSRDIFRFVKKRQE